MSQIPHNKPVMTLAEAKIKYADSATAEEVVNSIIDSFSELGVDPPSSDEQKAARREQQLARAAEILTDIEEKRSDGAPYYGTAENLIEFIQTSKVLADLAIADPEQLMSIWQHMPTRYMLVKMPPELHMLALHYSSASTIKPKPSIIGKLEERATDLGVNIDGSALRLKIQDTFMIKHTAYLRKITDDWYYINCLNPEEVGIVEYMKFSFNKNGDILEGVIIRAEEYHRARSCGSTGNAIVV